MPLPIVVTWISAAWLCIAIAPDDPAAARPHPAEAPGSPRMLASDWVPDDPRTIDFAELPRVPAEHAVVSDVRAEGGVNQHNYLAHHDGKLWIMWSDGPGVEDRVGQRVRFATSPDGLSWTEPEYLTPDPPGSGPGSPHNGTRSEDGFRWIARGFWRRDGELYALASLDEAAGFFGPSLALHAFRRSPADGSWEHAGVIADDTINNFPPGRLPIGEWMMSRPGLDADMPVSRAIARPSGETVLQASDQSRRPQAESSSSAARNDRPVSPPESRESSSRV